MSIWCTNLHIKALLGIHTLIPHEVGKENARTARTSCTRTKSVWNDIITNYKYKLHYRQHESNYNFTLLTSPLAGDQLNDQFHFKVVTSSLITNPIPGTQVY